MNSVISAAIPERGRIMGVDYGAVRVGLAICDADHIMASPLETRTRKNPDLDALFFRQVIQVEAIVGLVVGLPIHMNGDMSTEAEAAVRYGEWLHKLTGLPVAYHDERCTSSAAEDLLWAAGLSHKKRKERRDQLAAQFILQSFLDTMKPPRTVLPDDEYAPDSEPA